MLPILVSGPFSSVRKKRARSLVSAVFLTFSLAACEFNPFGDNAAEAEKQRNHELELACIESGKTWYGDFRGCANPFTGPRPRRTTPLFPQTTTPDSTSSTTTSSSSVPPETTPFQWRDRLPLLPPGGSAKLLGTPTQTSYIAEVTYDLAPAEISTQLQEYLKNARWSVSSASATAVTATSNEITGTFSISSTTNGSRVRIQFTRPASTGTPTTGGFDKQKEENRIRCITSGGTWYDTLGQCAVMPTLATTSPPPQIDNFDALKDCIMAVGIPEDVCYEIYG